jgi:hypothetical protein
MLIVAGMPNQPAKFMLRGMHNSQQASMGRPMNPMVQSACREMVLKPMDKVTLAEAQIRHKLSQFLQESVDERFSRRVKRTHAIPTTIASGLPPMTYAASTISLIEG